MRTALAWTLLAALTVAGCASEPAAEDRSRPEASEPDASTPIRPSSPAESPPTSASPPENSAPPPTPAPGLPVVDLGEIPTWPPAVHDLACPCGPLVARLPAPGGEESWVEARALWDGRVVSDVGLAVTAPDGTQIVGERGFDERRVQAFEPSPGTYQITLDGAGEVRLQLALKTIDGPEGPDRFPNLVTMRPQDFYVGGCDDVEQIEQGATRCLRFGNGIGNTGNGPLQLRLRLEEAAPGVLGSGHFEQLVLQADGSEKAHDVSLARFHPAPTHMHWHYEGVATYALYAFDPATGLRGEAVTEHTKAGFCLLDWDRMDSNDTKPWTDGFASQSCLIPFVDGWTMGITPGWYDFYAAPLTDQYVDVAGVPDGVYEFVSTADPAGTLDEWDETDNAASMVVSIQGDVVDVVEVRAYYQVRPPDRS